MMAFDDAGDYTQRRDAHLKSAANPVDEHVRTPTYTAIGDLSRCLLLDH